MWADEFRRRALVLQQVLNSTCEVPLPPRLQAIADRCREDLEIVLAATEPEMAEMLAASGIDNFEALRGLLRRQ